MIPPPVGVCGTAHPPKPGGPTAGGLGGSANATWLAATKRKSAAVGKYLISLSETDQGGCPYEASCLRSKLALSDHPSTEESVNSSVRSLGDTWADTTTSHGRLMLTVLGGLAEFERDLIRTRTGEGRARAVARGVKMGRPPKLTPHQQREAIKRRDRGEESLTEIGRPTTATISRLGV
jgi:hypothetical protein